MYAGDETQGDEVTSGTASHETGPASECPECFGTALEGERIKRCEGCGYAWDDETGRPVPPSRVAERRRELDR